jgi:hypothetical protein
VSKGRPKRKPSSQDVIIRDRAMPLLRSQPGPRGA